MRVVIFIPISRTEHLQELFRSLELLDCDRTTTSLLTYVDGPRSLFETVRGLTDESKFMTPLSAHRSVKDKPGRQFDILSRRRRIAAIHNEARELIPECEYVFLVEDDTIVPPHALKSLLRDYSIYPFAGFIQGVELGRWGITYLGAWWTDDVYNPTKLETLLPSDPFFTPLPASQGSTVGEVDAGGFYCCLTRRMTYVNHEFKPFDNNSLGPDVEFGLSIRQDGLKNYTDWGVKCKHKLKNGQSLTLSSTNVQRVELNKTKGRWTQHVTDA